MDSDFVTEKKTDNSSKMMTKSHLKDTYSDSSENETLMDFIKTTNKKKSRSDIKETKRNKYDNKKVRCS